MEPPLATPNPLGASWPNAHAGPRDPVLAHAGPWTLEMKGGTPIDAPFVNLTGRYVASVNACASASRFSTSRRQAGRTSPLSPLVCQVLPALAHSGSTRAAGLQAGSRTAGRRPGRNTPLWQKAWEAFGYVRLYKLRRGAHAAESSSKVHPDHGGAGPRARPPKPLHLEPRAQCLMYR